MEVLDLLLFTKLSPAYLLFFPHKPSDITADLRYPCCFDYFSLAFPDSGSHIK